ncbi:MAG: FliA/WhiG family RNA polymerase sigma factor [Gemmatimonadota bacterium]
MSPTASPETDTSLWRRYRRRGEVSARTELLNRHVYLVRLLARKLASRIGSAVEVDDLMSAGTIGLVQALESFEPARGYTFATFASRRVHGAMLDELRTRDWVPRSVRSKARQMTRASSRIESTMGRAAAPAEVAAVLAIDVPTYWSWRQSVDGATLVSLEASPEGDEGGLLDFESRLTEPNRMDALSELEQEERVTQLSQALAGLPERERMVLMLYFYEELNLREIADVLHLTESRISQIRTAALQKLRKSALPQLAAS